MTELGRTGIQISAIGLGGAQFARDGLMAKMSYPRIDQPDIDRIVKAAITGGITWFDTAEMYGGAETALSNALAAAGVSPGGAVISTKWRPFGRSAKNIERTFNDRRRALSPFPVDLYQIHMPYGGLSTMRAQLKAMTRLAEAYEIRAVGVSNFSATQMVRAHAELAKCGIPLASNQVEINLLNRKIETNGILEAARRLRITLLAYSPLRSGILTGKFHDNRRLVADMSRLRRTLYARDLDHTAHLIDELRRIGEAHSATAGQIALAWLGAHYGDTVVAIAGASKPQHADEAAGAMRVRLSRPETEALAELSSHVS